MLKSGKFGGADVRSDMIKKGIDRAPHRSLLYATGVKLEDMEKPFIGVCNSYIDIITGTYASQSLRSRGEKKRSGSRRHPVRIHYDRRG